MLSNVRLSTNKYGEAIRLLDRSIIESAVVVQWLCHKDSDEACGITSPDNIPSKFAYSRFLRKFKEAKNVVLVKNIMRNLTRRCYETFPSFGKSVAIDATDLKAWPNGSKTHKSDQDAGWVIKGDTNGKRKFVWGYKMHLMVDTTHEIPIIASITKGNTADIRQATPLLSQARYINGKFHPEYVICDAGYSSNELRNAIKRLATLASPQLATSCGSWVLL